MMTFILNDAPYSNEPPYNGLRLANVFAEIGETVRVYLMGDSVICAKSGQQVPNGYYNIGRMVQSLLRRGVPVHA